MKKFRLARHILSQTLELPEDAIGSAFRLQIIGNCSILCGCKKLLKYKSEEIIALTKDGTVTFSGEHLKCVYFFDGTLELSGDFNGVRFDIK